LAVLVNKNDDAIALTIIQLRTVFFVLKYFLWFRDGVF